MSFKKAAIASVTANSASTRSGVPGAGFYGINGPSTNVFNGNQKSIGGTAIKNPDGSNKSQGLTDAEKKQADEGEYAQGESDWERATTKSSADVMQDIYKEQQRTQREIARIQADAQAKSAAAQMAGQLGAAGLGALGSALGSLGKGGGGSGSGGGGSSKGTPEEQLKQAEKEMNAKLAKSQQELEQAAGLKPGQGTQTRPQDGTQRPEGVLRSEESMHVGLQGRAIEAFSETAVSPIGQDARNEFGMGTMGLDINDPAEQASQGIDTNSMLASAEPASDSASFRSDDGSVDLNQEVQIDTSNIEDSIVEDSIDETELLAVDDFDDDLTVEEDFEVEEDYDDEEVEV